MPEKNKSIHNLVCGDLLFVWMMLKMVGVICTYRWWLVIHTLSCIPLNRVWQYLQLVPLLSFMKYCNNTELITWLLVSLLVRCPDFRGLNVCANTNGAMDKCQDVIVLCVISFRSIWAHLRFSSRSWSSIIIRG